MAQDRIERENFSDTGYKKREGSYLNKLDDAVKSNYNSQITNMKHITP